MWLDLLLILLAVVPLLSSGRQGSQSPEAMAQAESAARLTEWPVRH